MNKGKLLILLVLFNLSSAWRNHAAITSRIPVILLNDGSSSGNFRAIEQSAIVCEYFDKLKRGSEQPDDEWWDKGSHGVAHMKYWFGDHVWHVGLGWWFFADAADRCTERFDDEFQSIISPENISYFSSFRLGGQGMEEIWMLNIGGVK